MNYTWESFKGDTQTILDKLRQTIHEGNVRRIVVKHGGRTIAEFPLSAGVVGIVIAPDLAAVAAVVALVKDCTIEIERVNQDAQSDKPRTVAM